MMMNNNYDNDNDYNAIIYVSIGDFLFFYRVKFWFHDPFLSYKDPYNPTHNMVTQADTILQN